MPTARPSLYFVNSHLVQTAISHVFAFASDSSSDVSPYLSFSTFPLSSCVLCASSSPSFALLPHHPQPSLVLLTICGGHAHTSCSWHVGNISLGVEYTTRAQDSEEAIIANDLISQAVAKQQTKDYPGALADLNHADHIRPGDYATLQLRGMLKMDIGDAESALADLDGNADTPDSSYRRGVAHFVHGHMKDAFIDIASANLQASFVKQ